MYDNKDKLLKRCLDSMGWMADDMTWRFDEARSCVDEGSKGGYSPELTRAIALRTELEEYFKQGCKDGRRQDAKKENNAV